MLVKHKNSAILCLVLSLFLIFQVGCIQEEISQGESEGADQKEILVELYYLNPCASCQEDVEFEEAIRQKLEEQGIEASFVYRAYNVFRQNDRKHMEEKIREAGLDMANVEIPAALVDGQLYQGGHQSIGEQLAADLADDQFDDGKQAFGKEQAGQEAQKSGEEKSSQESLSSGEVQPDNEELFQEFIVNEEEITIVYFYRADCPECNDTKPFIDSLPQTITLDGEEIVINLIPLNSRADNNGERIQALFLAYDVPSKDQMVPIIFLKDRYLAGQEEIEENLLPLLEQGKGQGFSFPQ